MRGPEFLARLREEVLIGDGALGTMLGDRVGRLTSYERLNSHSPELVRDLHAAYRDAGALVLETNTFGANRTKLAADEVVELNRLGVALTREAAADQAFVAGAVGPLAEPHGPHAITPATDDEIRDAFREQIVALADAGADLLMLETFTDLHQLLLALAVAKQFTDLPVVCQMAYHERGHTQHGVAVLTALEALRAAGADVIGANCGRGVRCVVHAATELTSHSDCLVSAYPNAGLPEYADGRYLFGAPLPYLEESADKMVAAGVNLIGGCCGTTPEYVRRVAQRIRSRGPAVRVSAAPEGRPVLARGATPGDNPWVSHIDPGVAPLANSGRPSGATDTLVVRAGEIRSYPPHPVPTGSILDGLARPEPAPRRPLIVVELDPPRGLNAEPILRRARQLADMGIDAITMADNPVATLHMGNLALARIVQEEVGVPVITHLTCRDHNLLGLQSILLAAHALGLHHLLALTGDPAKVGDQPGATSVYDLNSFGLVELINKFNHGVQHAGMPLGGRTRFCVGVAFNPGNTERKLAHELTRLRKKVAAGAHYAMTQPIYEASRFHLARAATAELNVPMFAGVMPLLSDRNAEFLHNEVPGIVLSDAVRLRMKGFSGKEGRRLGVRIAQELIDAMLPAAEGFYLIPPQRFTEMAVELVDHIQARCSSV